MSSCFSVGRCSGELITADKVFLKTFAIALSSPISLLTDKLAPIK